MEKKDVKTYSLAVGPNFRRAMALVDKQNREITQEDYLASIAPRKTGKAYGFFYYNGKIQDITKVLPNIVRKTKTPEDIDLEVSSVKNLETKGDSPLVDIVEQAERSRMSHVITATLPNEGNFKTANYLGNVLNGVHFKLYGKKEPFNAGIVYKRGDKYVFRRD